jgi:acyl-CoA dehydrogenase
MMALPDPLPVRAFLDPKHLDLAKQVADFAAHEIATLPVPADDAAGRVQAKEILVRLGSGGFLSPILSEDWRACCLIREALAAASPLADAVFALQALSALPIMIGGDVDLQKRWVLAALNGRAMGGFVMTEADAGSDVAAMATTARRNRDDYVLNGAKTLISNAGIADYYCVFAVTDRAKGAKGISCFLVPADTPGCRFVGPLILSSPHPLGELAFEDCRIPFDHRLGAEGDGYKIGLATLDRLRPTVGAAACGMAARALVEALNHATTRKQFGQPLADFQLVQEKLSRMVLDLTAARLLVYRAAWEKDYGAERITLEAGMAKAFATEAAQRIIDDAVQILGGRGVLADHPVDRLYRSVRALRIYEGTTEIQHLVIAGQLLKQHRGER